MRLTYFTFLLFSVVLITSCNSPHDHPHADHDHGHDHDHDSKKNMKASLIHTVFFWTNEGTTEAQLKEFEVGLQKLGTCPQIHEYYWGPPAPTEARGVVDNTYDYAINVHFASVENQNEYQEEPIHKEFIENHQDLWAKVIVYDNVVK